MSRRLDNNVRSRIAAAESDFIAFLPDKQAHSILALEAYARNIAKRSWWGKQVKGANFVLAVEFDSRRTNFTAGCVPGASGAHRSIRVDSNTSTKLHVLHSMAHIIRETQRSDDTILHDTEFVKIYLELVRRFTHGYTIDDDLKRAFKKCLIDRGVKTKTVSAEGKERQRAAHLVRSMPSEEQLLATLRGLTEMQ